MILVALSVVLVTTGAVVWRETSSPGPQTSPCAHLKGSDLLGCGSPPVLAVAPHRSHPLRAEIMWAGGGLIAAVALGIAGRQRRKTGPPPVPLAG